MADLTGALSALFPSRSDNAVVKASYLRQATEVFMQYHSITAEVVVDWAKGAEIVKEFVQWFDELDTKALYNHSVKLPPGRSSVGGARLELISFVRRRSREMEVNPNRGMEAKIASLVSICTPLLPSVAWVIGGYACLNTTEIAGYHAELSAAMPTIMEQFETESNKRKSVPAAESLTQKLAPLRFVGWCVLGCLLAIVLGRSV